MRCFPMMRMYYTYISLYIIRPLYTCYIAKGYIDIGFKSVYASKIKAAMEHLTEAVSKAHVSKVKWG